MQTSIVNDLIPLAGSFIAPLGRANNAVKRFNSDAVVSEQSFSLLVNDNYTTNTNLHPYRSSAKEITAPITACMEDPLANVARPSYMDNQATSPLDPRVLDQMMPYMVSLFGNPHSRTHVFGWETERAVERARSDVGSLINAARSEKEIIWTSGATESNNMVIKGVIEHAMRAREAKGDTSPVHIITTQVEHKCVLASCRDMEEKFPDRVKITYIGVNEKGLVNPADVAAAIIPGQTALVSVIGVHNEIGVIQDLAAISAVIKKHKGILFHSDIAQAAGKIHVDVRALGLDLASISGHKMYGPKGVGALYINSKSRPRIRLVPQMSGGGQERGLRSGTVPSWLAIGMGAAASVAEAELDRDHKWISFLSKKIQNELVSKLPNVILNGDEEHRYPGNLNLSFDCVEGESLIMTLKDVCAISSGSACTSASLEPSYVLRAIGVGDDLAHTSLRFGIGRFTTEEEVDLTVSAIIDAVTQLRELSPLWELRLQGKSLDDLEDIWT